MGLLVLIIGLIVLLGAHVVMIFRGVRTGTIARFGRSGYHALFSVVSLIGLALIIWGYGEYRAHEWIQLWSPPAFMRHITIGLMLFASVFITAAFVPSHIKVWLKHPALVSVKTWAFAHLLANGDLGSILLFGSFLAWAVYGRVAVKRRGDVGTPAAPAGWTNDVIVVAVGIIVFLALGYAFHPIVIGVPVFGR